MKFWKNIANTLDRRKRQSIASSTNSDGLTNDSPTPSATRRRRSQYSRSVIFLLFAITGYLSSDHICFPCQINMRVCTKCKSAMQIFLPNYDMKIKIQDYVDMYLEGAKFFKYYGSLMG